MAINEKLTNRVRELLVDAGSIDEKKMFSGIAFMVDDKMCVTVRDSQIMCRVDPSLDEELSQKPGCSTMIMNGREYKGFIVVNDSVIATKKDLAYWINLALDYNPRAQSSKKKSHRAK